MEKIVIMMEDGEDSNHEGGIARMLDTSAGAGAGDYKPRQSPFPPPIRRPGPFFRDLHHGGRLTSP